MPTPSVTSERPSGAGPNTAAVGDESPDSPLVLLQSYLRGRGISSGSPNYAQSMRTLLEAVHRGDVKIPGLMDVDTPSTDPGVGQSGNVAGKVESARGGGLVDEGRFDVPTAPTAPTSSSSTGGTTGGDTSTGPSISLGPAILGGLALGGGALGTGMLLRGRGGAAVPTPGGNVPPPVDVAPGPRDVIDYTLLPPEGATTGNRFGTPEPNPLDVALGKAVPAPVRPLPGQVQGPGPVSPVPTAPEMVAPNVGGPQYGVTPPPQVSTSPTLRGPGTPDVAPVAPAVPPRPVVPRPRTVIRRPPGIYMR